jgi:hypothetical protein
LIIGFGIDFLIIENLGVCEKLREELAPKKVSLPDKPQIAGALGGLPDFAVPIQTDLTGNAYQFYV